jgi:hypothetical protein
VCTTEDTKNHSDWCLGEKEKKRKSKQRDIMHDA